MGGNEREREREMERGDRTKETEEGRTGELEKIRGGKTEEEEQQQQSHGQSGSGGGKEARKQGGSEEARVATGINTMCDSEQQNLKQPGVLERR